MKHVDFFPVIGLERYHPSTELLVLDYKLNYDHRAGIAIIRLHQVVQRGKLAASHIPATTELGDI